jgi:hypothetical protein
MVAGLINEEIDKLLERQKPSPRIRISVPEAQLLATQYAGIVRRVAESLTSELADAIGNRRGLGTTERNWIEHEVKGTIVRMTSMEAARDFFESQFSTRFTLENHQEAAEAYAQRVRQLGESGLLFDRASERLQHGWAVHGPDRRRPSKLNKRRKVPAQQKLARPDLHTMMSPEDVMEVTGYSHASVFRLADEGKLQRIPLGREEPGRRRKFLVSTASVKKFIDTGSL